jgi:hypothetical protein
VSTLAKIVIIFTFTFTSCSHASARALNLYSGDVCARSLHLPSTFPYTHPHHNSYYINNIENINSPNNFSTTVRNDIFRSQKLDRH